MWAIGVIAFILICQELPFGFGRDGNKADKEAMTEFLDKFKNFLNYEEYLEKVEEFQGDKEKLRTLEGQIWENKVF